MNDTVCNAAAHGIAVSQKIICNYRYGGLSCQPATADVQAGGLGVQTMSFIWAYNLLKVSLRSLPWEHTSYGWQDQSGACGHHWAFGGISEGRKNLQARMQHSNEVDCHIQGCKQEWMNWRRPIVRTFWQTYEIIEFICLQQSII